MKKALLILMFIVSSTANAQLEKNAYDMYSIKKLRNTQSLIDIVRTDNVAKTCEAESHRRGFGGFRGAKMEACSFHDSKKCTIIVGWTTNNDILGHELRHCFAGDFH